MSTVLRSTRTQRRRTALTRGLVLIALVMTAPAQSVWVKQTSGTQQLLTAVTHGNGTYVAVGEAGAIVTSTDAAIWSPAASGTTSTLRAITHAGGQFVAAGEFGTILTSPDGISWTSRTSGATCFLSGMSFGGGLYVAVGGCGTIASSPDGITWTVQPSGTGEFLQSVSHADGLFVVTGANGTILTSADGGAWTARTSPTRSFLVGSGYFRNRYFAVGLGGVIASSPDGFSWNMESSGTTSAVRAIANDGTSAVVCGDNGTILTSTDGTVWSPAPSGQSVILSGATFADGKFLVVGQPVANDGLVLTGDRDPGILWSEPTVSVGESDGSVTLTIERLGPTSAPASITYQTAPGTATDGLDFTSVAGTAHFPVGESTVEIAIDIASNPEAEPPEDFTVTLAAPSPGGLLLFHPVAATVTIIDAQDSDFDNLPDDWELLYFGDVGAHDANDDPDADGNSNGRELADGTAPNDPGSASYRLTLGVSSGLGTVTASPDLGTYPVGTTVTLTPSGSGEFTFRSWSGDASGTSSPLVFGIGGDLSIEADFQVSLGNALDDPSLDWTTGGSGPTWEGQGIVTSDGADAAATGGLTIGQQSTIEARAHGPAELTFRWKVSAGQFDSYRFYIDSFSQASSSGQSDWATQTFFIPAGTHTIRWVYSKDSGSTAGSNQVWLDEVSLTYRFEDWQRAYFTFIERSDPTIGGPHGDPDKDGWSNLLEYLFDLHPEIPDFSSPHLPTIVLEASVGQESAAYSWTQHRNRADTLLISVEFSDSLADWQPLEVPIQLLSSDGPMDAAQIVSPTPISTTPKGFFRLKLGLLP